MPRLSEAARHLIYPSTISTTAFKDVEDRLASVGYLFDPWQQGFGSIALGLNVDGKYAATVGGVVASIPRQVGKTYTIGGLLVGMALEFPGLRAIWTSHHLRTTTATFRSFQSIVRKPKIFTQLDDNGIRTANGEQEIRFKNGSIIMFGARAQGFGRGMSAIDVEVFDEAQILSLRALEDMVPATNQAKNPHGGLIFFIGTPPRDVDDHEAFTAKRAQALAGNSDDDMVYVELSADPDAALMDHAQWRKANPSFPYRTPLESMLRMRKNIPNDDSWRREALGIWDESMQKRLISAAEWKSTEVAAAPEGVRSFGVAFSADGERQSVAGAVKHDGGVHVEAIGAQSGATDAGVQQLVHWFVTDPVKPERWREVAQISISGRSHAAVLFEALRAAGVPAKVLRVASTSEYLTACSMLYDAVQDRTLSHPVAGDDDLLNRSVAVSDKKERTRDGGWGWQATTPDGDETPLEAASLALWGAKTSKRVPGRKAAVSF